MPTAQQTTDFFNGLDQSAYDGGHTQGRARGSYQFRDTGDHFINSLQTFGEQLPSRGSGEAVSDFMADRALDSAESFYKNKQINDQMNKLDRWLDEHGEAEGYWDQAEQTREEFETEQNSDLEIRYEEGYSDGYSSKVPDSPPPQIPGSDDGSGSDGGLHGQEGNNSSDSGMSGDIDGMNGNFDNPPISPLVMDLDGDGVELTTLIGSSAFFDLDGDGFRENTGWVSADDGILAIDSNNDGIINDISEVFGNATTDGFIELAALDSNSDGVIDANDAQFSNLLVWQDTDSDGWSDASELQSLSDWGITAIDLNYTAVTQTQAGHDISSESSFTRNSTTYDIKDVWFEHNQAFAIETLSSSFVYDTDVFTLPEIHGYGELSNLWVAMSNDSTLKAMVETLVNADYSNFSWTDFQSDVDDIIFRWASTENVAAGSRGPNIDARVMETIEKVLDRDFDAFNSTDPNPNTSNELNYHWDSYAEEVAGRFLSFIPQKPLIDAYSDALAALDTEEASGTDISAMTEAEVDALLHPIFNAAETTADAHPLKWAATIDYNYNNDTLVGDLSAVLDDVTSNAPLTTDNDYNSYHFDKMPLIKFLAESGGSAVALGLPNHLESTFYEPISDKFLSHSFKLGSDTSDNLVSISHPLWPDEYEPEILWGGKGNDTMQGYNGDDIYVFASGDGQDWIYDLQNVAGTSNDELRFVDVNSGDISLNRADTNGTDLVISHGVNDSVTINNFYANNSFSRVELFEFADGTTWDFNTVKANTTNYVGTGGDDNLLGYFDADTINGGLGNDIINGIQGDDLIMGDDGNDYLIHIGTGNETLYGGDGNDTVDGGGAANLAFGDSGADSLDGGAGNDTLNGGTGNDTIIGGSGSDSLFGGENNDVLNGGSGADGLYGEAGADTITSGSGADYIELGGGSDVIMVTSASDSSYGQGVDYVGDFVQGEDVIDVSALGFTDVSQLSVVNSGGNTEIFELTSDFALSFNGTFSFTNADFIFAGAAGPNVITGTNAGETLNGTVADDLIEALDGNDVVIAGSGNDTLEGGVGADNLYGQAGNDVIDSGAGADYMELGAGNDTILLSSVSNSSYGSGVDYVGDFVQGEDVIDISAIGIADFSQLSVYSGAGYTEIFEGTTGFALGFNGSFTFTNADFVLSSNPATNTLNGTSSGDTLAGGGLYDIVDAQAGADQIYTYAGNDTIDSGTGADFLLLGSGNDTIMISSTSDSSLADGVDYVGDFVQGEDVIDVSALGFTDISDLGFYSSGTGYSEISHAASGFYLGFSGDFTFTNADFVFA